MASVVLSGRALENLKTFLEEDASAYEPGGKDPYRLIIDWALDPEHGGLPKVSGMAFSHWLADIWADWCDEPVKVRSVLQGAVASWCGGREF